jgi:hypothetical protein
VCEGKGIEGRWEGGTAAGLTAADMAKKSSRIWTPSFGYEYVVFAGHARKRKIFRIII